MTAAVALAQMPGAAAAAGDGVGRTETNQAQPSGCSKALASPADASFEKVSKNAL